MFNFLRDALSMFGQQYGTGSGMGAGMGAGGGYGGGGGSGFGSGGIGQVDKWVDSFAQNQGWLKPETDYDQDFWYQLTNQYGKYSPWGSPTQETGWRIGQDWTEGLGEGQFTDWGRRIGGALGSGAGAYWGGRYGGPWGQAGGGLQGGVQGSFEGALTGWLLDSLFG